MRKRKIFTFFLIFSLLMTASCSPEENLEQRTDEETINARAEKVEEKRTSDDHAKQQKRPKLKLTPFNGEVTSYSKNEAKNLLPVSNEEWSKAMKQVKLKESRSRKEFLSTLSFSDYQLGSSIQGKLDNNAFQLDIYHQRGNLLFTVMISKYGERKNVRIIPTYLPPPTFLYDHNVWMTGAKDRHVDFNIATGELGPITTLNQIAEDYPQFEEDPRIFYKIQQTYHSLSGVNKGDKFKWGNNRVLILSEDGHIFQIK